MQIKRFLFAFGVAMGLTTLLPNSSSGQAEPLAIQEEDSMVFPGNTFAERMHQFGYFETFLQSRFPEYHLKDPSLWQLTMGESIGTPTETEAHTPPTLETMQTSGAMSCVPFLFPVEFAPVAKARSRGSGVALMSALV